MKKNALGSALANVADKIAGKLGGTATIYLNAPNKTLVFDASQNKYVVPESDALVVAVTPISARRAFSASNINETGTDAGSNVVSSDFACKIPGNAFKGARVPKPGQDVIEFESNYFNIVDLVPSYVQNVLIEVTVYGELLE